MKQPNLYFKEIDSLRALSVLSVMIFHLDRSILPGGFTGVDCFFVISGFVVSHSLLRMDVRSLPALLQHFYARRLLRIAPALMVVLLVTAVASALFIPDAWLSKRNEEIGIASFFGLSNVLLARPSNAYFGPIAEFNPFTQTWSLGIEEQFYLIAPLILYLTLRRPGSSIARRTALGLTGALSLLSLFMCATWTHARPTYAFYLLPARFWELGCGVLIAMSQARWQAFFADRRFARLTVSVGIAALVASMIYADASAFPFPWALLGVAASSLLIVGIAAQPDGVLPWPLNTQAVQYIGRLSYSLYLWHWPVFVLFLWTVGLQSWTTRLLALLVAGSLGWGSYRFVEIPTRSATWLRTWRPSRVVIAGLALIALSAGTGTVVLKSQAQLTLSRMTSEEQGKGVPALTNSAHCENRFQGDVLGDGAIHAFIPSRCTMPVSTHRMFVIGDSHAIGYAAMLARYAADTAHEVRILRRDGCSFVSLTRTRAESADCKGFFDEALAYLHLEARPGDMIFLASLRLPRFADQWGSPDAQRAVTPSTVDTARTQLLVSEAVAQLSAVSGTTVVFEAPKPLFRSPPFRCIDWFNASNPACAGGLHLTRIELEVLRQPVLEAMSQVSLRVPNVHVWDPAKTLCDSDGCDALSAGHPLYFDGDHLSVLGNAAVYPAFAAFMASIWP